MKILVTGATGFVGRWLTRELVTTGHTVVGMPPSSELDLQDEAQTRTFVEHADPEALVHLAAVSFGPDAERDPDRAFAVNVGATASVIEAVARLRRPVRVLVSGSSEVYGRPDAADLPLRESSALRATGAYGRSKIGQEQVAVRLAAAHGIPLVVTRSFNHTGPGQRRSFVAPAMAARIDEASRRGDPEIRVGNVDVRRDFGDVRDVVRAYRLLLEAATPGSQPSIVNVCTGRSIAIRHLVEILAELAGTTVRLSVDPALVRHNDPEEIVGDPSKLMETTGWRPEIPLRQTLADVLADVRTSPG